MTKRFWKWWQICGIVITTEVFIQNGALTLLRLINTWLLPQAEVPFVSVNNVGRILTHHPWIFIAVVSELIVICVLSSVLFMTVMLAMEESNRGTLSWRHLIRRELKFIKKFKWWMMPLFLVEFVALAPLLSIAFRTPLLSNLRIPEVILDYGTRNGLLLVMTGLIYLICFILTIHNGGTLTKAAITSDLHLIHEHQTALHFFRTLIITGILSWLINGGLLLIQKISMNNHRVLSVVCLTLAQIAALFLCSWLLMRWGELNAGGQLTTSRPNRWWSGWSFIMLVLVVCETSLSSNSYFQSARLTAPVTISHRGVANHNGVQNSIAALKRTNKDYHPNYVEMDVHETKDHQFVVMHDENLQKLTTVNRRPNQLTLDQLTHLTMHENGQTAKIASLDNYLRVANQLHQKLIIELKTTPNDSPDVVAQFNRRYGQLIVQRHYLVHSLDYGLLSHLQRLNPRMKILYLQAYNLTNPQPQIKGFNNEYSSLNERFINAAHRQRKPVYAWTVNNPGAMNQLINQHVDGIVTDDVSTLQRTIRRTLGSQTDAERYWSYLNPIANLP